MHPVILSKTGPRFPFFVDRDRNVNLSEEESMILSTHHTAFTVKDLARSVAFYRDVLGGEMVMEKELLPKDGGQITGIPGAHLKIAMLRIGGHLIELIQYLAPAGKPMETRTCDVGNAHACWRVRDMAEAVAHLEKHGVKCKGKPLLIETGINKGGSGVYFTDPDGITLEFLHLPGVR